MRTSSLTKCVLLLSLFSTSFVQGQQLWKRLNAAELQSSSLQINQRVQANEVYSLNVEQLSNQLKLVTRTGETGVQIEVPLQGGELVTFELVENNTMHPDLAAKYPSIKAYTGVATDKSGRIARMEWSHNEFHGMIFSPSSETQFIDPLNYESGTTNYMVYRKGDVINPSMMSCELESVTEVAHGTPVTSEKKYGSCEKRTYRLAVSATAEYTAFQGGTVALALAAQVTTINRVNGVYEKELAINLQLVANNDLLIYTDAATDPFTNGNTNQMIGANGAAINGKIGASSYDIGHVFGTNSGGLASLQSVCSNSKAQGVTGSAAPKGDPFDIDYVAHEMGHQFGGNHTQNNDCNRAGNASVEPGSGSTIMGYAGICAPNVQNNSDDHFHGNSLEEIGKFITSTGHTCPVKTALNNNAPVIASVTSISVPKGTPFALTANATDGDGDVVTYGWEQMDRDISTQAPVATSTKGPNFKSMRPTTDPTRYFPSITAQTSGNPALFTWERLPTVARTMKFRVSVRDNHPGGSCTDHKDMTINMIGTAGPFVVLYPNASGIHWAGGSTKTITWDVANTTAAPISSTNVDVKISVDGGLTFTVLADNVPNDGSQVVTIPAVATTKAIIMVMSQAGTFFDVSDNLITIETGSCLSPDVPEAPDKATVCNGDSLLISIGNSNLNDATEWRWYTGSCGGALKATGTSIYVKTSGFYYVRGEGGCVTPGACRRVNISTSSVNKAVSVSGGTLTASQSGATYQWINCTTGQAINAATNRTFNPTTGGNYAVKVTNTAGCTDTSDCVAITFAGINEAATSISLSLYPNPTTGKVVMTSLQPMDMKQLHVIDITGKTILVQTKQLSATEIEIDLSEQAKGIYYAKIISETGNGDVKIVKQ